MGEGTRDLDEGKRRGERVTGVEETRGRTLHWRCIWEESRFGVLCIVRGFYQGCIGFG